MPDVRRMIVVCGEYGRAPCMGLRYAAWIRNARHVQCVLYIATWLAIIRKVTLKVPPIWNVEVSTMKTENVLYFRC